MPDPAQSTSPSQHGGSGGSGGFVDRPGVSTAAVVIGSLEPAGCAAPRTNGADAVGGLVPLVLRSRSEADGAVHYHLVPDPDGEPAGRVGFAVADHQRPRVYHLELWPDEPDARLIRRCCRSAGELATVLGETGYYLAGTSLGDLVDDGPTR